MSAPVPAGFVRVQLANGKREHLVTGPGAGLMCNGLMPDRMDHWLKDTDVRVVPPCKRCWARATAEGQEP